MEAVLMLLARGEHSCPTEFGDAAPSFSQGHTAGADVNKATKAGGATALHRACYMGHIVIADLL